MSNVTERMQKAFRNKNNHMLLLGGVAGVTAGLGLFWYAQKTSQAQKETTKHPGAIPTWEHRLGQEQLPAKDPERHLAQRSSKTEVPSGPESARVMARKAKRVQPNETGKVACDQLAYWKYPLFG
ncbi:hypothetical protein C8Q78DRAFT_1073224 [Trametes maxima]|nr:hypothetical protein C8Q78DRAFT_1073224 [Trametes maxima]